MFEKWTKRFTSKATDGAMEGFKETLNDKIDRYGDIIQIGLVLSVIIFGGNHLTRRQHVQPPMYQPYQPMGYYPVNPVSYRLPGTNTQPIVINNYYQKRKDGGAYSNGYSSEFQRAYQQQIRNNCHYGKKTPQKPGPNYPKR